MEKVKLFAYQESKPMMYWKPAHPVKDVLKTTSPTCVPVAPNDLAFQIEPSSSTSLASHVFQGLSAKPKAGVTEEKPDNFPNNYEFPKTEKMKSMQEGKARAT